MSDSPSVRLIFAAGAVAICTFAAGPQPALAATAQSADDGIPSFGIRYRYEQVDQADIERDGKASTARARLTWEKALADPWSMGIEADYAFVAGVENFNSTTNGKTGFPVIADPQGFDLNQAYLRYQREGTTLTFGRQRINHGSQRMVGGVAFRQNEQTYDGVRVQSSVAALAVDYAYIHNVNRIFGPDDGAQPGDWFGNSHILRATFQPADGHSLAAFGYLLDFENANGPGFSNATYGMDYEAVIDSFTLNAAIARQSDWGDNPVSYDALYSLLQGTLTAESVTATVAIETLGSDEGRFSFRTPLGTLHKFQGWTDKFLVPPPNGVQDRWASVSTRVGRGKLALAYHDFRADQGGAHYGSEIGVALDYPLREKTALTLKVASYSADEYAADTTKFWVMVDWRM